MPDRLLPDALRVLSRYVGTLRAPLDLKAAHAALEPCMFDEHGIQRDDVLNVCQRIDDVLA